MTKNIIKDTNIQNKIILKESILHLESRHFYEFKFDVTFTSTWLELCSRQHLKTDSFLNDEVCGFIWRYEDYTWMGKMIYLFGRVWSLKIYERKKREIWMAAGIFIFTNWISSFPTFQTYQSYSYIVLYPDIHIVQHPILHTT